MIKNDFTYYKHLDIMDDHFDTNIEEQEQLWEVLQEELFDESSVDIEEQEQLLEMLQISQKQSKTDAEILRQEQDDAYAESLKQDRIKEAEMQAKLGKVCSVCMNHDNDLVNNGEEKVCPSCKVIIDENTLKNREQEKAIETRVNIDAEKQREKVRLARLRYFNKQ